MSSRAAGVLVGLLVLAVLGGTVAMWIDFRARVDEATTAVDPGPATPTPTPTPSATPSATVESLWIGDGYTAESCDTAADLGWECLVNAQRGTGFLRDGSSYDEDYSTLAGRLGELPRREPDVVVVDAGRNDLGVFATAAVIEAMGDYLARLREKYPDAALVQIVPWTSADPQSDPEIAAAVEDLMATYDGTALEATGQPLVDQVLADRLHDLDLPAPGAGA